MITTIIKNKRTSWTTSDIPNLEGKTVFITGANSGLGYYTAKALAEKNAHVLLACRTLEKANSAIGQLKSIIPNGKFTPIELDLSDLNNVCELGSKFSNEFENLDLLINNAGIMHPPKTLSAQGYEIQFAVNHLAHMLLTLKLLPLIERKEKSRIVTVTSGAQFFGKVGWNNLKAENYYNKWESYANSKLANVILSPALLDIAPKAQKSSVYVFPPYFATNACCKLLLTNPDVLPSLNIVTVVAVFFGIINGV